MKIVRLLICLFLAFGSIYGMSRVSKPAVEMTVPVGVTTITYMDESRQRPVVIELWYPTSQNGDLDQPQDIGWIHPKAVRDATMLDKRLPLVVVSHGNGGDRRDMSWLSERLVKKGFIVAAVEHHGNSSTTYDLQTSLRFWERSLDISFAITRLLEESSLKNKIDPDRIGFLGYSLGGMTGLSVAGAQAENVKEVAKQLNKMRKEVTLEMIEGTDFTMGHKNFGDPRIKAFALLCPATFVYPNESLKQIKKPLALVASEGDEILPFKDHSLRLIAEGVPAKLKVLREKVSHYIFLNRVSEAGKKLFCKEIQTKEIEAHRVKFHDEVAQFVTDFLAEELS